MEAKRGFTVSPQVVLGLIVLTIGVLLTLHNFYYIDAHEYLRYWPLLLVIYGLAKMLQPAGSSGRVSGLVFFLVGALLFLDKLDVIYVRIWQLWPIILIVIGGGLLWRASARSRDMVAFGTKGVDDASAFIKSFALLGGIKQSNSSQEFRGGELSAIMGGCEVDLTRASIKDGEAVIDVFAFWGGIEMKVPMDWSVVINGVPLLGGFDDKTSQPKDASKRLVIKGFVVMGGIEVTN
jgi:predicted membrane protein